MADVRLTATNPEDSSVVPVACDASGRLLLQELPAIDTIDGDLTVTGKGSFAGGKSIIGNDGSAQFAQGAVDIYANGTVEFTQDVTFDSVIKTGSINVNNGSIALYDNGSAIFNSGTVKVNGLGRVLVGADPDDFSTALTILNENGSASFAGEVQVRNLNSNYRQERTGAVFQGYAGGAGEDPAMWTSQINSDGSASFTSEVQVGSYDQASNSAFGASIYSYGAVKIQRASGDGLRGIFEGWRGVTNTLSIKADGSASFADNKAGFTAEGYLWCTTRRGDTVILDATSNGLASWVEYTPTTKREEIRDGLNAIRGDAAEMPADTP